MCDAANVDEFQYATTALLHITNQPIILAEALLVSTISIVDEHGNELRLGAEATVTTHNTFLEKLAMQTTKGFDDSVASAISITLPEDRLPTYVKISGVSVERTNLSHISDGMDTYVMANTILKDLHNKLDDIMASDESPQPLRSSRLLEFDKTAGLDSHFVENEPHTVGLSTSNTAIYLEHGDFYDRDLTVLLNGQPLRSGDDYFNEVIRVHKLFTSFTTAVPYGRIVFKPHVHGEVSITYRATGSTPKERDGVGGDLLPRSLGVLGSVLVTKQNMHAVDTFTTLEKRVASLELTNKVRSDYRYRFNIPGPDEYWYTFAKFGIGPNNDIMRDGHYHLIMDMLGTRYSIVLAIDIGKTPSFDVVIIDSDPVATEGEHPRYLPKIRTIYMGAPHHFEGALLQLSFKRDDPDVCSFMPRITNLSQHPGLKLCRPLKHGTIPPASEPINIHCADWVRGAPGCMDETCVIGHKGGELLWTGRQPLLNTVNILTELLPLLTADMVEMEYVKSVDLVIECPTGECCTLSVIHSGSDKFLTGVACCHELPDTTITLSMMKAIVDDVNDFHMSISTITGDVGVLEGCFATSVTLNY